MLSRLDEVAEVTETSLQPSIGVAEPLLHCVDDVLLPQLVLVAHTVDVLLGCAATVLQLLDDVEVSEVRCVDYSLCAETNLAAYQLEDSKRREQTGFIIQQLKTTTTTTTGA